MNGDDSEKKEESHDATIDVLRKDEQDLAVIQALSPTIKLLTTCSQCVPLKVRDSKGSKVDPS
jgi:hypothetical protein